MAGAADIAHLLGGAMLVLSLLMLAQHRVPAGAYALQSACLAGAAAAQGLAQDRAGLFAVAILLLGVQMVAVPAVLRPTKQDGPLRDGGSPAAMALGVGVVILAILAVRTAALPTHVAREDMAAALSVVLLGMLGMVTRRGAAGQVIGLLSAVSGCSLAAVSVPGLPLPVIGLGLALLAIPLLGVAVMRRGAVVAE